MPNDRSRALAAKLNQLWGRGLPPGDSPFDIIAEDAIHLDDALGRAAGLVVQGDAVESAGVAIGAHVT